MFVSREPSTAGSLALPSSCTTLPAAVPRVSPRLARAARAEVAPVPPLPMATVPVTLAALPLMLPLMSVPGMVVAAVMAVVPVPFT